MMRIVTIDNNTNSPAEATPPPAESSQRPKQTITTNIINEIAIM